MLKYKLVRDNEGNIGHIETALTGYDLLAMPRLNKGCAFSVEERQIFQLTSLLPYQIETMEQQIARMYAQYHEHTSDMGKNIYLNMLHDYNETLFYKLVSEHLEEMLPIIYTPTVGDAVERFSLEHRKPRGHYINYPERDQMEAMLDYRLPSEVDLVVVTDGEAVLGIGDQGIGGMNISSAKLMVYTLCAGINPHRVLPIQLDVGTNNPRLLSDPMYLGWRHERISGEQYEDFIEQFMQTLTSKLPNVFIHWEDIGRENARNILAKYRHTSLTFNDDMQGTGVVALACILAGIKASGIPLAEHRIVIFGAGTAGVGIADQISDAMLRYGLSEQDARQRFWLLDKQGLLTENSKTALPFHQRYLRTSAEIVNWQIKDDNFISLAEVVNEVKPTILIGCSAVPSAFTEEIIRQMASHVERPFIMPLSNPNAKAEATPEDILRWTNGKALIATGSPFPSVEYADRIVRVAQSNNAFAFPGIGLGAIAVKARQVTDNMLFAATQALSEQAPIQEDSYAPLLPKIAEARKVSHRVALAVAHQAVKDGVAQLTESDIDKAIKQLIWEPKYYPFYKG